MFSWAAGTEIAIWGTGRRARKFFLRYRNVFKVKFFIDNFPTRKKMEGVKILHPKEIGGVERSIKTVIAIEDYFDVCRQCCDLGMRFFFDYLPYDLVEFNSINLIRLYELLEGKNVKEYLKMIMHDRAYAVLIGNCQIINIKRMLLGSKDFQAQYIMIDIPPVYAITESMAESIEASRYVFEDCSLFVTQHISRNNGYISFLSTDNIKSLMRENAHMVVIPTLYCDLYFPQTVHQNKRNELLKEVGVTVFPYGDFILNELAEKYSIDEIQRIVKWDNLFSVRLLQWHFRTAVTQMLERESKCDVTISDYILENFKKKQLFYTKNHPIESVFYELGVRILCKLGFEHDRVENIRLQRLDSCQELIYPSVSKFYNFAFQKELYMDSLFDEECSIDEMVRMYLVCLDQDSKAWGSAGDEG